MSAWSPGPRRALLVTAVTFAALALGVLVLGTVGADTAIRDAILVATTPEIVTVMRVVNVAGSWKFLLPATLLLYVTFGRVRRTRWIWLGLMIAAPVLESVLKIAVARPRPEGSAYGFPSGHAIAIAAYVGAVLYLAGELRPRARMVVRVAAIALMLAVGMARIVLRAHWPSDVVAGLALGLALASAAALLASRADAPPASASSSSAAEGRARTGS